MFKNNQQTQNFVYSETWLVGSYITTDATRLLEGTESAMYLLRTYSIYVL